VELMGGAASRFWLMGRSQRAVAREFGNIARVGGEDAALLGTAGLPAQQRCSARSWVRGWRIDAILEEQDAASKQAAHGEADFDRSEKKHGFKRRLHHREDLCVRRTVAWPGESAAEAPLARHM